MLTPEEKKALKTPLKDMTPALLAIAVAAREKQEDIIRKENAKTGPIKLDKIYLNKDYEPFTSPVTGEVISGRAQLRDHLKATNCRIVEPSETRSRRIPNQN
ncbi:hypothetical protein UFOVP353_9 [uncultured Caudovirales phage]|uniref:Uncharacterized protein n=1 Tax=uncultured Caudovirales phage TaxID=2100421 RepID=A0A6J5LYV7_9CAUD|nr:hypothetical protein UFOVP353_9 [uncultured Caudovirales phage]